MKKNIQRFIRESKQNSLLGQKRRFQTKLMLFGLMIFAFTMTMVMLSDAAPIQKAATMAIVPIAGVDLTLKAKKVEEMSEEEKVVYGTIQKQISDSISLFLKGYDPEAIDLKLKNLQEGLEKDDHPMTKKMKEAIDLVEKSRETIQQLALEVSELKNKNNGFSFEESEIEKSFKSAFDSERYQSFANGTAGKASGQFEICLKNRNLIQKGMSVGSNHTGTVMTAYQSDVVVNEIPMRRLNLRDFMTVTDASGEEFTSYYFLIVYDIDRAAIALSENGSLPEGSFKTKEGHAETKRIGWHITISKRMLRKISIIQKRLLQLLPNGMDRAENFQLLYGDSTGSNFQGITQVCKTESVLTGNVYAVTDAGQVTKIESYNGGAATMVTLAKGYSKIETGMKIIFSGFQTCTALNSADGFIVTVVNDHTLIVPCTYTAETASSVQTNAKFTVKNMWGKFIVDANEGDALRAVISFLNFDQYMPNLICMNSIDVCSLMSMKDYNGRNMASEYIKVVNGIPYLDGLIPIATFDCIPKGKAIIGDFMNACELFDTQKGILEFAEDVNTKLANQIVSLIQEEVIFAITCPDAFLYIDIENTKQAITTSGGTDKSVKVSIVSPLNSAKDAVMMDVPAVDPEP